MKNLFLFIVGIIILTSCNGSAQQNQGQGQGQGQGQRPPMMDPEKMSQMQTQRMTESLGLNEEQAKKAGEINLKFATEMKEMMGEPGSQPQPPSREKMEELQNKRNEEFKAILTPEQYEKMLQDFKERMHRGPGGPGGQGGPGGPDGPQEQN